MAFFSVGFKMQLLEKFKGKHKIKLWIPIQAGDEVEVNFDNGEITDLTTGKKYQGQAFHPFMQNIITKGGLISYINSKEN